MSILRENNIELSVEVKELILKTITPIVKDMVILLGLAQGRTITGYKKNLCEKDFGLYENIDLETTNGKILDMVLDDILSAKFYENFDSIMCNFPILCKDNFSGISEIAYYVLEDLKYNTNYVSFIHVLSKCDKEDIDDYKKYVLNTAVKFIDRYVSIRKSEKDELLNSSMITFEELDEALGL